MIVGIPQGLLFSKYNIFAKTFLEELGAEVLVSPDTNKRILDDGVRCSVDEACLPMKVFHGHIFWLKDKCDAILIPRFISIKEREYICPMFCGLIEMISNDIPSLPLLIDTPIYSFKNNFLFEWAQEVGRIVTKDESKIISAFNLASQAFKSSSKGFCDEEYPHRIALIGHTYNIFDRFINMDLKNKLNRMGIGTITSDNIDKTCIDAEVDKLFKKPFWTFARDYYGSAISICKNNVADGIIYLSSFSCGIDSVVIELIKNEIEDFPFMVLKLDEHTGEAGFDTRLEAFSDMLKRRCRIGNNVS